MRRLIYDDCVAGRLHRWARRRDRLVGAGRGAVSVPHPAGAGDRRKALRTAALRNDALLGDGAGDFAARGAKLGLIDEWRLFVSPILLGGGTPYVLPLDETISLELVDTQTFGARVVYLRYRPV
jgi:riboflavin biosynthesis pyrimidine reductase